MIERERLEELELAGQRVRAISVGGIETFVDLPGLKLAFDIGCCPEEAVGRDTILFTHAHIDHMGGVAYHAATRALQHMPPPRYVVPRGCAGDFERLFEAWRRLDHSQMEHTTIPLAPGEELQLNPRLVARAFPSEHTVTCQGYALWSSKRKLKPAYRELGEEEVRRLAVEQGVEVSQLVERCELALTGDTLIEVVESEEVVRKAPLLILETTFLDDRVSVAESRAKGHVHLDEVIAHADAFENQAILMMHFSRRYRRAEIERILAQRLPRALQQKVVPLLTGFD